MRLGKIIGITFLSVMICMPAFGASEIMVVNDKEVTVETNNYNGNKLIALRQIGDSLGLITKYDSSTKGVEVSSKGGRKVLKMTVGSEQAIFTDAGTPWINNGYTINKTTSVPPTIINGSTYVPLRFVADTFDCIVSYIDNKVHITQRIQFPTMAPSKTLYKDKTGKMYSILAPSDFWCDENGVYCSNINTMIALSEGAFKIKNETLPGGLLGVLNIELPITDRFPHSEFMGDWSGYGVTTKIYKDMSDINSDVEFITTYTNPKNKETMSISSEYKVLDKIEVYNIDNIINQLDLGFTYTFDNQTGIFILMQN